MEQLFRPILRRMPTRVNRLRSVPATRALRPVSNEAMALFMGAGFEHFRRATQTPFNLVHEARK